MDHAQEATRAPDDPIHILGIEERRAAHHAANLRRFQADPRSKRIVPISPRSSGPRLLIDGHTYARYVDEMSAREAIDLLRDHWPAASGRLLEIVTG